MKKITLEEALIRIDGQYKQAVDVGRALSISSDYLKGLANGFSSAKEFVKEFWDMEKEPNKIKIETPRKKIEKLEQKFYFNVLIEKRIERAPTRSELASKINEIIDKVNDGK